MPVSITFLARPSATFTLNLRVRDWNGDEWPLEPGGVTVVGTGVQFHASYDEIGQHGVGLVSLAIANANLGGGQVISVVASGQIVATINVVQHSGNVVIADGIAVADGATVAARLDRRTTRAYDPSATAKTASLVKSISTLQSGHGFVLYTSGGASPFSNLNETLDPYIGTQHAWAGTAGGPTDGQAGIQRFAAAPIDMTNAVFRLTFKIKNVANLNEFGIFLGTGGLSSYCRIYAHSNQGQWLYRDNEINTISYPIGLRTFAAAADYHVVGTPVMSAITDIRVRIIDGLAGPNAGSVEIHVYEMALVSTQPRGKIVITFDDQDASVYSEAFIRMKQRNMVGANFIIASTVGASGKMTQTQLDTLHMEWWDNCCHAFSADIHNARIPSEPESHVETDMIAIRNYCLSRGYRGAYYYASPGGEFEDVSVSRLDVIRRNFKLHRTINTRQSETHPMADPHRVRPIYVTSATSVQLAKDRIDCVCLDSKGIAVLVFHKLVAGAPAATTEYTISNFEAILDHIVSQGYDVTTFSALEADGVF